MIKYLIILSFLFIPFTSIIADDNIVMPKAIKTLPLLTPDIDKKSSKIQYNKNESIANADYSDELLFLMNDYTYSSQSKSNIEIDKLLKKTVNEKLIFHYGDDIKTSKAYSSNRSNDYTISTSDITSSSGFTSAITTGLSAGYDSYINRGTIDLSYASTSAILMFGSTYLGSTISNLTEITLIRPIITNTISGSIGTSVATVFGNIAGGVTVGSLFAIGAYATGSVDRHTARLLITKSAVGSTAVAGTTLLLGTSTVATGIFSVGTLIIPYLTVLGTYYLVDKLFIVMDKIEEQESMANILNNR